MVDPGDFGALIALRAKRGEARAVEALHRNEQLRHIQPLIELDGMAKSSGSQLEQAIGMARTINRLGRIVLLDAASVPASPAGRGPVGTLHALADRLSGPEDLLDTNYPVRFIPVARGDMPDDTLRAIGRLCEELEAGGALRVEPSRTDWKRVLDQLDVAVPDLDVVLDLRYLSEVTTRLTDTMCAVVRKLDEFGRFRSITVLSGSIPKTLTQTASWQQRRFEEVLCEQIKANGASHIRFGDYGVVHPIPGKGFGSKHVNVKYTCPDQWLYLRERVVEDDRGEASVAHAFREVCRHLVDSGSYSGPDFSWGDREFSAAATGREGSFGDRSRHVALGTSHHLAYLAQRAA